MLLMILLTWFWRAVFLDDGSAGLISVFCCCLREAEWKGRVTTIAIGKGTGDWFSHFVLILLVIVLEGWGQIGVMFRDVSNSESLYFIHGIC